MATYSVWVIFNIYVMILGIEYMMHILLKKPKVDMMVYHWPGKEEEQEAQDLQLNEFNLTSRRKLEYYYRYCYSYGIGYLLQTIVLLTVAFPSIISKPLRDYLLLSALFRLFVIWTLYRLLKIKLRARARDWNFDDNKVIYAKKQTLVDKGYD